MAGLSERLPNGGLKVVCSFLVGLLVMGLGHYAVFGRDLATRQEVAEIVQSTSPYVTEREGLKISVQSLTTASSNLAIVTGNLVERVAKLEVEVKHLQGK